MRPSCDTRQLSCIHVLGHHDADGIVSAAIAGSYLRACHPDARISYGIVDFHLSAEWETFVESLKGGLIPGWPGGSLPDGIAIVDFPAADVPDEIALFYADHHETSFRSCGADDRLKARYESRAQKDDTLIIHDPSTPSCVSLLLERLDRTVWTPPKNLIAASKIADVIDRAAFADAGEAVNHRTYGPAAVAAVCLGLSHENAARTAEALASGKSLRKALFELHAEEAEQILSQLDASLDAASVAIETLNPNAVVIDWTHEAVRGLRTVRFLEYFLTPALYAARLEHREVEDGWCIHVSLGRSPWITPPPDGHAHPHLGLIAESIGGGGHPYAAGFRLCDPDLEEARRRAIAMTVGIGSLLRPLELGHPMADPETAHT